MTHDDQEEQLSVCNWLRPLYIRLHKSLQVFVKLALLNNTLLFRRHELSLARQSQHSRYVVTKVLPLVLGKLVSWNVANTLQKHSNRQLQTDIKSLVKKQAWQGQENKSICLLLL